MNSLYCRDCGNYLMASDGECHDCPCGWKQPVECNCSIESAPDEDCSQGTPEQWAERIKALEQFCNSLPPSEIETLRKENEKLKAELKHWKANHANVVKRLQVATQRLDLPVDRVPAIGEMLSLQTQVLKLQGEADIGKAINNVCGSLPAGCGVVINLERGAGDVVLVLPDGNEIDMDVADTFADKINNTVKEAERIVRK